ncbi:unnamed protein product, partial [Prorocentrum cordatum]
MAAKRRTARQACSCSPPRRPGPWQGHAPRRQTRGAHGWGNIELQSAYMMCTCTQRSADICVHHKTLLRWKIAYAQSDWQACRYYVVAAVCATAVYTFGSWCHKGYLQETISRQNKSATPDRPVTTRAELGHTCSEGRNRQGRVRAGGSLKARSARGARAPRRGRVAPRRSRSASGPVARRLRGAQPCSGGGLEDLQATAHSAPRGTFGRPEWAWPAVGTMLNRKCRPAPPTDAEPLPAQPQVWARHDEQHVGLRRPPRGFGQTAGGRQRGRHGRRSWGNVRGSRGKRRRHTSLPRVAAEGHGHARGLRAALPPSPTGAAAAAPRARGRSPGTPAGCCRRRRGRGL